MAQTKAARNSRRIVSFIGGALVALCLCATPALAAPLAGSNYDSQDGNQANNLPGSVLDWQKVATAARLAINLDDQAADICFGGGTKEDTPNAWFFNTTAGGCTPGKSNLLGVWSHSESTNTSTFLHASFARAAASGNTFITFELNKNNTSWTNGVGAVVPCRSNGDLLLSYEIGGATVDVTIFRWTGDGTGPPACPDGANGTFTNSAAFNNGMLAAADGPNYLSTAAIGATASTGLFGEAQIDVAAVLNSMGVTGCFAYLSSQAHTRSSSSISSALIDMIASTPTKIANCSAVGSVFSDVNNDGVWGATEGGIAGRTVYVDYDGDSTLDPGEPAEVTDADGSYQIAGVAAGSYSIRTVLPVGSSCTAPATCTYSRTFGTSGNSVGNDFGTFQPPEADLEVDVTAPAAINPGADFDYTITTVNNGPDTAGGVEVSFPLPAGVTFVSASPGCTEAGGIVTCLLGTMANGQTIVSTITVTATGAGNVSGTATVTSDEYDPTPANDSSGAAATTIAPTTDMKIYKSGPLTVAAGGQATYTITVDNLGPTGATGTTVTDDLPAGMTFDSANPSQGTCNEAAGTVTCDLGSIANGAQATIDITVDIAFSAADQQLINTAEVDAAQSDPQPGDNADSATTQVGPAADISLSKTSSDPAPNQGEQFSYSLTAVNNGPSSADNVVITDTLAAGVSFVSADPGCVELLGTVTCNLGTLAAGATGSTSITVVAVNAGNIDNTATVTSDMVDPSALNNSDTESVTVAPTADIELGATGPAGVVPLSQGTYTFTATNNGPSTASNVELTGTVPVGLLYVSSTASDGTCNELAGIVTCALGSIASGAQETVTITAAALVAAADQSVNVAASATADENDPDGANNDADVDTLIGPAANVSISKVADNATVQQGDSITYTLEAGNAGPSTASAVTITDVLPAGVTYISSSPGCAEVLGVVTCTIGALANGATAATSITVQATGTGNVDNTATVTTTTLDNVAGNDSDTASVAIGPTADLQVGATGPSGVAAGTDATYTLTVENNGPSSGSNVTVTDTLPAGMTYVSATPSTGTCSEAAGVITCGLGTLASAGQATIAVVATAGFGVAGQTLTSNVAVGADEFDSDAANNTGSVQTLVGPAADLTAAITAPGSVPAGGNVVYTVSVSNAGGQDAGGVVITDTLPLGVTYVSAVPSQGTCGVIGQTISCALGSITNGGGALITVTATAGASLAGTTILHNAGVSAAEPDPDSSNNAATGSTAVSPVPVVPPLAPPAAPDQTPAQAPPSSAVEGGISVTKTADKAEIVFGRAIGFTITVTNNSSQTVTGVTVIDQPNLAAHVESIMPDRGTCAGLTCSLGQMASGESVTIRVIMTPLAPGTFVNSVTATSDQGDSAQNDNTGVAGIQVQAQPTKLRLTERLSRSRVRAGKTVWTTLTLKNVGKYAASNVRVCSKLPRSMSFVAARGAEFVDGSACWTHQLLKAGRKVRMRLKLRVLGATAGRRATSRSTVNSTNAASRRAKDKLMILPARHRGGGVTG